MTDFSPRIETKAKNPLVVLPPPTPSKRLYNLAEYLKMEAKATRKHEYFNGQIIAMPYARASHNLIASNISTALNFAIKKSGKKLFVLGSDQLIYNPNLNVGVYADALVVCENFEFFDNNEVLLTNPILVVEVFSRSTKKYDRTSKFDFYKTLPSFREYVLVEQKFPQVETRFRMEPQIWRENVETNLAADIRFDSLGLTVSMADIYENLDALWKK